MSKLTKLFTFFKKGKQNKYFIECGVGWYYDADRNAWRIDKKLATVFSEKELPIEIPHPIDEGDCVLDNCATGAKHIWIDCVNQKIARAEKI